MDGVRRQRLLETMDSEKLDALVCRLPENVLLLTGYWPICGWAYAVLPQADDAICIVPSTEEQEARDELEQSKLVTYPFGTATHVNQLLVIRDAIKSIRAGRKWRRIGFEAGFETAAPAWNVAETYLPAEPSRRMLEEIFGAETLINITGILEYQKAVKTKDEIEKVARAARISCIGIREFCSQVDVGTTGVDLAVAVESATMRQGTTYEGAKRVRAFAQVASGPDETYQGWRPAEISTTRKVKEGDIALLELAVVADGYWSDRTRARVAGKTSQRQEETNEIVRRSQAAAIAAAKRGVLGREVDEAARKVIREAGMESAFVHVTGHGLGYRYHEATPSLAPWSSDDLEEGMIHSVEPGVYLPGFGGIRIEDDVVITSKGAVVLGPYSTSLR